MHMSFSFFSFEEIFQKSALFSCLSSTAKLPPRGDLLIATVCGGQKSIRQYKPISKWLDHSQYPGCTECHWHKDHLPILQPHPGLMHCWHIVWRLCSAAYISMRPMSWPLKSMRGASTKPRFLVFQGSCVCSSHPQDSHIGANDWRAYCAAPEDSVKLLRPGQLFQALLWFSVTWSGLQTTLANALGYFTRLLVDT